MQVNLSPALSNDCDVDNQVKKPLLHDMFDLLGLPMCNTGLSLFRMSCGSASGPRFVGGRPTALAVAATEKWKSRRKITDNINNNNPSKKDGGTASTQPQQQHSTARQTSSAHGPGGRQRFAGPSVADMACGASSVWGNGRDWRRPVDSDGDWVRVFPFGAPSPESSPPPMARGARTRPPPPQQQAGRPGTAENTCTARATIKNVREYLRCCAKVARSFEGLTGVTDDEYNDKLRDLFPAVAKVWLPPV